MSSDVAREKIVRYFPRKAQRMVPYTSHMKGRIRLPRKSSPAVEMQEREPKSGVILAGRRGGGLLPRELEHTMQTTGVLLVAVERGASLPNWIGHCQDRVSDVFLLVGNLEEPRDALLKRVEQRLTLLSESEPQRGLVVLVAEPSPASPEAEEARMQVADRLLGYLSKLGEGILLLLSDDTAPLESRVQLLSMAGTLAQQVRGTKLSISVRFGTQNACEPPQELFSLSHATARRTTRRPPPQSGQMPKPSMVPALHKTVHREPSVLPKRRLSNAS